jgi:glutamate-1-semialdehyde 2,1-aminomutase
MSSVQSHEQSAVLLSQAADVIPGGVNSGRRNMRSSICMRRAEGAYFEDVDGNRYIDYHAAFGPVVLGHSHRALTERVSAAIRERVCFGVATTEPEVELAGKIVKHVPSVEQVLVCNSGNEATHHAIRLARGVTGRDLIVRFTGAYHGFHDFVMPSAGAICNERTIECAYNELASVENAFAKHPERIAAVIVEPIMHNSPGAGIVPSQAFLEGLRRICSEQGAILVFDEIITGFRHALGGYQSIVGITPDLTTMGKAIANGFPIAAIGGRRELMEQFDTHPDGIVAYAGTYNGNACSVEAALATIETMESEPVHERLFALGDRMRAGLREIARRAGIPAHVSGFGSLFVLSFMEGPIETMADLERNNTELFLAYRCALVERGVFEVPENVGRSHISYSHTEADIDRSLEIAEAALSAALETCSPGA